MGTIPKFWHFFYFEGSHYKLSDYQLLSLHVLGSITNLLLVSPEGSGKTQVIYLGTLLLRKVLKISELGLMRTSQLQEVLETVYYDLQL